MTSFIGQVPCGKYYEASNLFCQYDEGSVKQVCIGSEGTVKPALVRAVSPMGGEQVPAYGKNGNRRFEDVLASKPLPCIHRRTALQIGSTGVPSLLPSLSPNSPFSLSLS